MQTLVSRELQVEVVHNIRHLGDYSLTQGGTSRGHDVIRSASLRQLSRIGAERLVELGVKTVVDLRSGQEREQAPTMDLESYGIATVHAPVFEYDGSPSGLSEFPGFVSVYETMLETGAPAYRALMEALAAEEGAVLFHCAAGKDRTGLAAALLLDLAGVAEDEIIEDYVLSAELLRPQMDEWLSRMAERDIDEQRALQLMAANAGDMAETIDQIHQRWGGAAGYMASLGLDSATIDEVRCRLTGW